MKYCVECGTKLEKRFLEGEGEIPFCPNCNEFRFPIFNCAVSMEVLNPDKNIVLKFSHKETLIYPPFES